MHEELLHELETIFLPETDGVPLENIWHRKNIYLLCDSLENHWLDRHDFFIGGNMCVYYSLIQAKNRDFLGPDVFVVQGVDRDKPRQVWATWREDNRGLDVVIELLSPTTGTHDLTDKKDLYEQKLHTKEYFCYDPETHTVMGWRLDSRHRFQKIEPASDGRLWCEELGLWLGTWEGLYGAVYDTWLRWFDADGNLCLLLDESEARRADAATERADAETERANAATERAKTATERANAEAQRAAKAEAELERLRAQLAAGIPSAVQEK